MQNIYKYNNDFDRDVIFEKLANIEEQIQDVKEEEPSKERNKKVRDLMYAQFMQGLRLSTGFNHF